MSAPRISYRADQRTTKTVFNAYGNAQSTASTTTLATDPFGYGAQVGYYTDRETGLILCQHRYYDPAAGRWINRDPIRYAGGLNLYSYVHDSPTTLNDPSGDDPPDAATAIRLAFLLLFQVQSNFAPGNFFAGVTQDSYQVSRMPTEPSVPSPYQQISEGQPAAEPADAPEVPDAPVGSEYEGGPVNEPEPEPEPTPEPIPAGAGAGAAAVAEPWLVPAIAPFVIAAGIEAGWELINYSPGKPSGIFTCAGQWWANQLIPPTNPSQ